MLAYIVRRLLVSIPVLILATFVLYLLVAATGDPLDELKHRNPKPPQSTIDAEAHKYGLDKPVLVRYWDWLSTLVSSGFTKWGVSTSQWDIGHELAHRTVITIRLVALAMFLAVIFAVFVGVISAVFQYSIADYVFTFSGFLFLSLPVFWFAILLKQAGIWANVNVFHQTVLYTIGDSSVYMTDHSTWAHFKDIMGHMVLPTITLALTSFAAWSRFQRASMLEVLNSDYVRLARAKGLSRRKVMVKHALRTALIPLTTVTALDIGAIIGGAVITETVFQWHGMGDMLITSIIKNDVNAAVAWLLVAATAIIVFNLIADVLYAVLDPRIRYE